jgi:tRNA (cmo5U34)-methyltransferase
MNSTNFSFNTIKNFDDHIQKSIANYDLLAESIVTIADFFTVSDTSVIDIGCSTGKLLEAINHAGKKIGVDNSKNLLPRTHENTYYLQNDLRDFNDYKNSSLIMSIFTLQFIDKEYRPIILKRIYDGLINGGAFIWAEKVMCESGQDQDIMTFTHYDYKLKSFLPNEILSKEKDLRLLMRTQTSQENIQMAERVGFTNNLLFWKFYNFECWLLRKKAQ